MINVTFIFKGENIIIQCNNNDKMKDICNKFITKVNIDINSVYFLFNVEKLNLDSSLKETFKNYDKANQMNILVMEIDNENENVNNLKRKESKDEKIKYLEQKVEELENEIKEIKKYINFKKETKDFIKPYSEIKILPSEKIYFFFDEKMDFGIFLNKIEMNTYDKIIIKVKKGKYFWNEPFTTPCRVDINISDENYHEERINQISFYIKTNSKCCHKNHSSYAKLMVRYSSVNFSQIDIFENEEKIKSGLCGGASSKSVFIVEGDDSKLSFYFCHLLVSSSPFINIWAPGIEKIIFDYASIRKHEKSENEKIIIVKNDEGWNSGGQKGMVFIHDLHLDDFCFFEIQNDKIEYIEYKKDWYN